MAHFNFLVAHALRLWHWMWLTISSSNVFISTRKVARTFILPSQFNSHGFWDWDICWDERNTHVIIIIIITATENRVIPHPNSLYSRRKILWLLHFVFFTLFFLYVFVVCFFFRRCDCNNHIGDLTIQSHFVLYHIVDVIRYWKTHSYWKLTNRSASLHKWHRNMLRVVRMVHRTSTGPHSISHEHD